MSIINLQNGNFQITDQIVIGKDQPQPRTAAIAFRKNKKLLISSFEAQNQELLLKFVPVLRYILTLRFRDAAAPGARALISCKEGKLSLMAIQGVFV